MTKLSNVIFYNKVWGPQNVICRYEKVLHVPEVGESVILSDYVFFTVKERIFDFNDNLVHIRVEGVDRSPNLAI